MLAKVYTDNILIAEFATSNITQAKRKASKLCNNYNNVIDTLLIDIGNWHTARFVRINKKSPDNMIVRGKWK